MKRVILRLVMLVALCAVADTKIVDGREWAYIVIDGNVELGSRTPNVTAVATTTSGSVVIPKSIGGMPVRGIGAFAFSNCQSLSDVIVPKGVTYVGLSAFANCSGINDIVLPVGVQHIESHAYANCRSLNTVVIPATVTNIGEYAFFGCDKLSNVTLPPVACVSTIAPDSVRSIVSVCIPDGTDRICDAAFFGCINLKSVIIPDSVAHIGIGAFQECEQLSSIALPNGIPEIGRLTFFRCTNLTELIIPQSVTNIGVAAFESCRNLKQIHIPSSVRSIEQWSFNDVGALKTVYIAPGDTDRVKRMMEESGCDTSTLIFEETTTPAKDAGTQVYLTITNIVIHYVQNVAQSAAVSPVTSETGFVNVITEIKGGNVAVPDSWATNYPNFVSRFGSDFTKALMMPTKKKDGANNSMLVWQDYVAGTDPTKEDDVFKASITRDGNGKIIISHTPEFKDANEKEKRKYTTLGKKSLMDSADWEVVPEGHEADYNFFKVTVEMKP